MNMRKYHQAHDNRTGWRGPKRMKLKTARADARARAAGCPNETGRFVVLYIVQETRFVVAEVFPLFPLQAPRDRLIRGWKTPSTDARPRSSRQAYLEPERRSSLAT